MDSVSAVVVTFNRKALLEECLTALFNQTRRLDEIIVIDNASTDGTEELIKTKFADSTYLKLPRNIGGSGGFYKGIKLAYEKGHDWIWVMDDDAVPTVDALEKLLSCSMIHQDNVYALASAVLNRDGSIYLNPRRLFDPETLFEAEVSIDKYELDYFQMDTASFVGFLIRRKFVEVFGLPTKDFFIYYDDTEYSLRIRNRGIMLTVPDSRIIHGTYRNAAEQFKLSIQRWDWDWKSYYFIRNRIYTYRKHGNRGLRLYIKLMRMTLRTTREILTRHHSRLKNINFLLWGTLDGLIGKLGTNNRFLPR